MEPESLVISASKPKSPAIDFRAVAVGLLRRLPLFAACVLMAALVGTREGHKHDKKTFKSETLLRFERHGEIRPETDEKTTVLTLKDTVKTEENIRTLKAKLGLDESLGAIGKVCDVQIQKNTTLMTISAQWKSSRMAAAVANSLRDIFLENYRSHVKATFQLQVRDLQKRLDSVRKQLKDSDALLQGFTTTNRVVDIDKQSRALLEEANSMSVLLEQALAERKTVEEQSVKLDGVIKDLKDRVAKEQAANASLESLSDLNIRIGKLKETIKEDKDFRANLAEMNLRKQEMDRAKTLHEMGAISQLDYQRSITAYEKAKIATQDTEQVKSWKADLEKLQKVVVPEKGTTSPSTPILQTMLVRTFDLQMQRVSVQEKVTSLQQALSRVRTQLTQIPFLQRQYDALFRNVKTLENERKELEDRLALMQRSFEAETPDFTIITEAKSEMEPISSNGKMITLGIVAAFLLLGLLLLVVPEILDTTVRSGREVERRLKVGLLGVLPRRRSRSLLPGTRESRMAERLTMLSQRIRAAFPESGAHIQLASASTNEGSAWAATNLAACFGRQGERVILVDVQTDRKESSLLDEVKNVDVSRPTDINEFLHGGNVTIDDIIEGTSLKNVDILSRRGTPISPDLLGSTAMANLYEQLRKRYSVILTISSPVNQSIEAQMLSRFADGSIFVTKSKKMRGAILRRAIAKLQTTGTPILGAVLTGVSPIYVGQD